MNKIIFKESSNWTIDTFLKKLKYINLKPDYQREFVYDDEQQAKVIDSILLDIPLNIIYLNENDDNEYEVIDGQQRLRSIDNFINHTAVLINMTNQSWNNKVWSGLGKDLQSKIKKYPLEVKIVSKENDSNTKFDLFKRINTVGEQLNEIELLNATYPGAFVNDIKKFCHDNESLLSKVTGRSWLKAETEGILLSWFSDDTVKAFLSKHQNDPDAKVYKVMATKTLDWVEDIVPKQLLKKIYKNSDLHRLFKSYNNIPFDKKDFQDKCNELWDLVTNNEIQSPKGIMEYALQDVCRQNCNEQLLNLRAFPPEWKLTFAQEQNWKCAKCGKSLKGDVEYKKAELDHIISWKEGGLTEKSNCQLLCQKCNRQKKDK